jgi:prevent-host-death family protein
MKTINVHEAKTHLLSRLLESVEQGEEVIIARAGKPIAKLVPLTPQRRQPGGLKGKIRIHPDFDAPLPDEVDSAFRGESR